MRRFGSISLLILCLLCPGLLSAQTRSVKEEQDFSFAQGLLRDGNAALAAEQFRLFLERYPESPMAPDAAYYRGEALFAEGRLTDAGIVYRDLQTSWPKSRFADEAGFRQGEIFFRQNQFTRAFETFSAVLREYPMSAIAHEAAYWAGEAALRSQDPSLAMRYYTIAYENYPDGRVRDFALYSIGYVLESQSAWDEAIATYTSLLKHYPTSALTPFARTRIGSCLVQNQRADSALVWLSQLNDGPDQDNAAERLYLMSEARAHLRQLTEAERGYKDFLAAYPHHARSRQVQYRLGWCLVEQQKYSESLVVFDTLSRGADELAQAARYRTGMVQRMTGRFDAAQRTFLALIGDFPSGPYSDNAHFELGMTAFGQRDLAGAERRFEDVIARYPESEILPDAWLMLGETRLASGRAALAAPAFATAAGMRAAGEDLKRRARLQEVRALIQAGSWSEARLRLQTLFDEGGKDDHRAELYLLSAEARYGLGDLEGARADYLAAADRPASATLREDARYGAGWTELRLQRPEAAEREFRTLLSDFPTGRRTVEARIRLGDALAAQRRFSDAAPIYRAVAREFPADSLAPYALLQLGMTEHRAGDSPAGLATLKSLLTRYPHAPQVPEALYATGWILFQNKDYRAAIEEFRAVLARAPTHALAPRAQYTIADALYNQGSFAEAEAAYRLVLEVYPASPLVADALDGIAECLRMQNKNDEASRVKQDWLSRHQGSAVADEVAYTEAVGLLRSGDRTKALSVLRSFSTTWPTSARRQDALLLLGRSLAEDRAYAEAHSALRDAASIRPGSRAAFDARLEEGRLWLEEQEADSALLIFDRLLEESATASWHQEARLGRARALVASKDVAQGRQDLASVIAEDPTSESAAQAVIERAKLDARDGQVDQALTALDSLASSRTDGMGARALVLAGNFLFAEERWEDAEKTLLRVGYVFPEEGASVSQSYLLLGRVYEAQRQLDKARQYYRKTVEQFGGSDAAEEAQRRLEKLP